MGLKNYFRELNASCSMLKKIIISIAFASAILIIDELNIPSTIMQKPQWVWILIVAAGLIIILSLVEKGIWGLFKSVTIHILDQACIISSLASIICILYTILKEEAVSWKMIGYASIVLLSVLIFIIRAIFVCKKSKKPATTNVIDLKELFDGTAEINSTLPILIEDYDNIDYDLLNHDYVVQGLYQSIIHCRTEESFTFGLEGPWGSGKTAIINKVKKLIQNQNGNNNQFILIDDFDPWLYGSKESMLLALYDMILNKMDIKVGRYQSLRLQKALASTIADTSNTGKILSSIFFSTKSDELNVSKIHDELKRLLKHSPHRCIIFIDNLDRVDSDIILFVFKLVATFFDLPNTIYVLSYDKERVCAILNDEKQYGAKYLDKIVQATYQVPLFIHSHREKIVKTCIHNLLTGLGVSEHKVHEYDAVIDYIVEKVDTIRSFKRLLNSVFINVFIHGTYLSKSDLLAIEVIHFFDEELYQYIISHRHLFISIDRLFDHESAMATINSDKFNLKAKEEFDSLFKEKPDCLNILSYLFPTVKNYKSKYEIIPKYSSPEEYKRFARKMAICSAKYFDLYFHSSMNNFAVSSIHVQSIIQNINKAKPEDVDNIISQAIEEIPGIHQKEWFEQFELHMDNLSLEKRSAVAIALVHNWNKIADHYVVLALSARARAAFIVHHIISDYDKELFASFLAVLTEHYEYFLFIRNLISFYQNEADDPDHNTNWQKELIKEQAYKMGQNVIKQEINLFADAYYIQGNTRAFAILQTEYENGSTVISDFLNTITTSRSIYRFLLEITGMGSQSGSKAVYLYYIHPGLEEMFSVSPEKIDQCLKDNPANNESKQFLVNVYEKYRTSPIKPDDHLDNAIESEEEVIFNNI